jgi:hypothetical protein
MTGEVPSISISMSLTPNPHSYSSLTPPILSLTVTSHASRPLTIMTWHTLLYPDLALVQSAFRIRDLTAGTEADQTRIQLSRLPLRRQIGSYDEGRFLTLFPEQPATVSTPFGNHTERPRPEGHPERMKQCARGQIPRRVRGVDGLVVGRKYELSVCGCLKVWWWRWGTREEVLEPEGGPNWSMGESETAFEIDAEEIEPVTFHVVE